MPRAITATPIRLPAPLNQALDEHAKTTRIPRGQLAAQLIERGLGGVLLAEQIGARIKAEMVPLAEQIASVVAAMRTLTGALAQPTVSPEKPPKSDPLDWLRPENKPSKRTRT